MRLTTRRLSFKLRAVGMTRESRSTPTQMDSSGAGRNSAELLVERKGQDEHR